MAEIILKFERGEEEYAQVAMKSVDLYLAIDDFDQWLREEYKYRDQEYAYDVRDKLREFLDARGVNLEMLS